MPVQRIRRKTALLAAVTRFTAYLLSDHIAQNHQALFGTPFFCFVEMIIHQLVEHAHRRMTLQLTSDIDLSGISPLTRLKNIRQHQFGGGTCIFLNGPT